MKSRALIGDKDVGVSGVGNISAKVPLDQRYGETAIKGEVGVNLDYKRAHAYVGATSHLVRKMPTASGVINGATNNPDSFLTVRGSLDLIKGENTTVSAFAQLDKSSSKKGGDQGQIGIRIEKKF